MLWLFELVSLRFVDELEVRGEEAYQSFRTSSNVFEYPDLSVSKNKGIKDS